MVKVDLPGLSRLTEFHMEGILFNYSPAVMETFLQALPLFLRDIFYSSVIGTQRAGLQDSEWKQE